jgi:hypothetical protein
MNIVRELIKAAVCLATMLLACDLLLTLHDIRNELRAARKRREARVP